MFLLLTLVIPLPGLGLRLRNPFVLAGKPIHEYFGVDLGMVGEKNRETFNGFAC